MAKDRGIYIPKQPAMLSPSYLMTDPFFGPPMVPRALNGHPSGQHSDSAGMRDMVSVVQSMYVGKYVLQFVFVTYKGGSVAEWLASWTRAQKGLVPDCSRVAVG